MCGICGIYDSNQRNIDKKLIISMMDSLKHRGPDDFGFFFDNHVALGHRRLSIIDLKTGKQPVYNEDQSITIVYNGEIYNFQEIKKELETKGHKFYTNTDTEVIVHAYEEYGESCLNHFNGMFAFAVWDSVKKQLFLARDRLGVKPVYYYFNGSKLLFASELKSILKDVSINRQVDLESLNHFFAYEYIPSPMTIFQGINKLSPAHYLILKNNKISLHSYWDINFKESNKNKQYFIKNIPEQLKESVRKRLISDVPLGAFLSGGIDSSAIVSLMSQLTDNVKTFTIGFEQESYSESKDARLIAEKFNTDHHEKIVSSEDIIQLLSPITKEIDEPFGDLSIFPTYLVSQFAGKYVKVVLSGDGGDELFAGYDWYLANKLNDYYRFIPGHRFILPGLFKELKQTEKSKGVINKTKRFIEGTSMPDNLMHIRWMTSFDKSAQQDIYSKKIGLTDPFNLITSYFSKAKGSLNKMQYVDIKTYLPDDILTKVDRASMLNSLEARTPFLDYTFVEFAATIPQKYNLHFFDRKYIFKKSMQSFLPKETLYKSKQGFTMPMKQWLRTDLKDFMLETLSEKKTKEIGFLNQEYINKVINQHLLRKKDNQRQIWAMMNFHIWYENYMH